MRVISTDIGLMDLDNPADVSTLQRVFPNQYSDVAKTGEIRPAAAAAPAPSPVAAAPLPIAKPSAPATYSISTVLPPPTNGSARINQPGVLGRGFGTPQSGAGLGNPASGAMGGMFGSAPAPATTAEPTNPYAAVPTRQPVMSAISRYNAGVMNTVPGRENLPGQVSQAATPYNVFANPVVPKAQPLAGSQNGTGMAAFTPNAPEAWKNIPANTGFNYNQMTPQNTQWGAFNGNNTFQIGGAGGFGGW